eukprot:EG_transcript_6622
MFEVIVCEFSLANCPKTTTQKAAHLLPQTPSCEGQLHRPSLGGSMLCRITSITYFSAPSAEAPSRLCHAEVLAGTAVIHRTPDLVDGESWEGQFDCLLPQLSSSLTVNFYVGEQLAASHDLHPSEHPAGEPLLTTFDVPMGHVSLTSTVLPQPSATISSNAGPDGPLCDRFEGHEACVSGLAIYNGALISVAMDNSIRVWSLTDGRCLHQLEGHQDSIHSLAIHGSTAATGSDDRSIRLWNLATGTSIRQLQGHSEGVNALLFHGSHLLSASDDGTIKVWDWQATKLVQTLEGHLDWVSGLAIWKELLFSCSDDGTIRAWNLMDFECAEVLLVASHDEVDEESCNVNCIAVDGDLLYAGVGPHVLVWRLEPGPIVTSHTAYKGHQDEVRMVLVDSATNRLYSCSDDGTVKVWRIGVPDALCTFEPDGGEVFCLAQHGRSLYSGAQLGTIQRWTLPSP